MNILIILLLLFIIVENILFRKKAKQENDEICDAVFDTMSLIRNCHKNDEKVEGMISLTYENQKILSEKLNGYILLKEEEEKELKKENEKLKNINELVNYNPYN